MALYDLEIPRTAVVHETVRVTVEAATAEEARDLAYAAADEFPNTDIVVERCVILNRTYTTIKPEEAEVVNVQDD